MPLLDSAAGPQVRVPFCIEQFEGPLEIDQLTPAAVGRVSVRVAEFAVEPPEFEAVMLYPIFAPASTPVVSGVRVTPSFGALGDG